MVLRLKPPADIKTKPFTYTPPPEPELSKSEFFTQQYLEGKITAEELFKLKRTQTPFSLSPEAIKSAEEFSEWAKLGEKYVKKTKPFVKISETEPTISELTKMAGRTKGETELLKVTLKNRPRVFVTEEYISPVMDIRPPEVFGIPNIGDIIKKREEQMRGYKVSNLLNTRAMNKLGVGPLSIPKQVDKALFKQVQKTTARTRFTEMQKKKPIETPIEYPKETPIETPIEVPIEVEIPITKPIETTTTTGVPSFEYPPFDYTTGPPSGRGKKKLPSLRLSLIPKKPKRRRKKKKRKVIPLADWYAMTVTEGTLFKRGKHPFPTVAVKKKYLRVRKLDPLGRFPTAQQMLGLVKRKKRKS